ncbi:MAG: RrF2 family transcriptional regulator [Agathobacter sp.]|nr:RrF2 family transcriptional regulator [Agathobacter sp.]
MMISTRGRYALRVLLDLGAHYSDGYVPMKDVAKRQELSLKYIEKIMPILTKNKLVEGVHGKGGGYRLTMKPEKYRVGDVLRLAEGDLAPVACLGCDAKPCERAKNCPTLPMWTEFYKMLNEYFDGITLADLMQNNTTID